MNLSVECQLLIFENVDFFSLMSLVETNKHFRILAMDIFRRKFAKKTFKYITSFGGVTEIDRSEPEAANIFFTRSFGIYSTPQEIITLESFEMFAKVLKIFGHLISSLKIKMSQYDPNRENVKRLVKFHCIHTLNRLYIDSDDEQFFDAFTKPFANVELLSLAGRFNRLDNAAFANLNELFPAVRSLHFGDIQVTNVSSIACAFQNLTELQVFIEDHEDLERIPEMDFRNLIKKNPKIRIMRIDHGDIDFLKFVSDELKHLERLTLLYYNEYYPNGITNVHFENVKRFTIYSQSPKLISFGNLVEFETDSDPQFFPKWSEYVSTNKHLRKLLWTGLYMNRHGFSDLVSTNSNLLEIHVICQADVDYSAIVEMLDKCSNLRKLHLDFVKIETLEGPLSEMKESLRDNLSGKWTIREGQFWTEFFIERKILNGDRLIRDDDWEL